ncbi:MAG: ABC-F family ATP-binding cassette domain-containing protein [Caldisericaceae bacterium]
MLTVSNLNYINGNKYLLKNVSFVLDRERKVIIGDNGSGKTTLLEIIVGTLPKDSGAVSISGSFSYVPQEVKGTQTSGLEEIESGLPEIKTLEFKLSEFERNGNFGREFSELMERYEAIGGYIYKQEISAMLDEFGLDMDIVRRPLIQLSGGERTKCLMIKAFIAQPDILILDEPTNHLDIETIEILEKHIAAFRGGVLIVSHDKVLINKIATSILYLENGTMKEYPGNYEKFVYMKSAEDERVSKEREHLLKYLAKEREFIEKFRYGTRSTQAKSREKKIERIEIPETIRKKEVSIRIESESRGGEKVIEARNLAKSYGDKSVLKDVNLKLMRGERVGLLGKNGSGKTTLLKIIVGEESPDSGFLYIGASIHIGYFPQDSFFIDGPQTILEEILKEGLDIPSARDFLASFDFTGDDVFKRVNELSGGEKRRLILAKMSFINGNFLVLDEPTNHLDIETNDAVISALKNFKGTILLVTHDRYLLKEIANKLYYLDNGRIELFEQDKPNPKKMSPACAQNRADANKLKEANKIKARIVYLEKFLQREQSEKKERELRTLRKKLESMKYQ